MSEAQTVILRMTQEQAEALVAVLRLVGGDLHNSGRRHIELIRTAIESVFVVGEDAADRLIADGPPPLHQAILDTAGISRTGLWFRDYPSGA